MTSGIIGGVWDMCHSGHLFTIAFCKSWCDELVVALQTDPTIDRPQKNKPIQTTLERYYQLDALQEIAYIIPYDTEKDLENLYAIYDFQIRFIGDDHKNDKNTGDDICMKRNIQTIFIPRFHDYSTTSLRKRVKAGD